MWQKETAHGRRTRDHAARCTVHRRPQSRVAAVTEAPLADGPQPELSRARSRTLFFALSCSPRPRCGPVRPPASRPPALVVGLWSVVGRTRPRALALAHLRGLRLAAARPHARARRRPLSPLLVFVPLLVIVQLLPSERGRVALPRRAQPARAHRPGHRRPHASAATGLSSWARWPHSCWSALRRRPGCGACRAASGAAAAPAVDASTGFYSRARLKALLPAELAAAEAAHEPLALVCVRLDHFRDLRDFRGQEGSEAVVRIVARRLKRTLGPDDLAFRLSPDLFAFTLRGRDARVGARLDPGGRPRGHGPADRPPPPDPVVRLRLLPARARPARAARRRRRGARRAGRRRARRGAGGAGGALARRGPVGGPSPASRD